MASEKRRSNGALPVRIESGAWRARPPPGVRRRCAISGTTCRVASLTSAIKHSVAEVIPVCPYPRDTGFFLASTVAQVRAAWRAALYESGVIKEV